MKLINSLPILSLLCCELCLEASNPIILSVVNKSNDPVQISYLKTTKGPLLRKLIEQDEALTFGIVEEAMISGVGVIGKYITPEPFRFFPIQEGARQKVKQCIAIIEGTKNRSLTKPFGDWNIRYIFDKSPAQMFPPLVIPKKIIGAFPTAVRMNVFTSRFILGLPEDATVDDALAAERMLIDKWTALRAKNPEENQTIIAIIHILNKACEAFEQNKPDEVFQELVPSRSFTIALAE